MSVLFEGESLWGKKFEFTVGQKVTVMLNGNPNKTGIVKRILKAFVELTNGERFQADGTDTYPRDRGYSYNRARYRICPWEQKHSDFIRASNLRLYVGNWLHRGENIDKLKLEQLEALKAIITIIDPDFLKETSNG